MIINYSKDIIPWSPLMITMISSQQHWYFTFEGSTLYNVQPHFNSQLFFCFVSLADGALLNVGPFSFTPVLLLANLEAAVLPLAGFPPVVLVVPAAPLSARCKKWCNCWACGALPRISVSCSRVNVTSSARLSTRFMIAKIFFEFTPGIFSSMFCGRITISISVYHGWQMCYKELYYKM